MWGEVEIFLLLVLMKILQSNKEGKEIRLLLRQQLYLE